MPEKTAPTRKRAPTLYAIIASKLIKGILLLLLAVGAYNLSDNNLPEEFRHLLNFLHLDPEKRFFTTLAEKISLITESKMVWFARGTFIYSLFSLVEGTGLLFRVRWVVWLTIGESAFFVPIEIHELMLHFSWTLTCILTLNILIIWYLYQNRERLIEYR